MIPDFSQHPQRLAIKSTICQYYNGRWQKEERDSQGNITKQRELLQAFPPRRDISAIQDITKAGGLTLALTKNRTITFPLGKNAKRYFREDE